MDIYLLALIKVFLKVIYLLINLKDNIWVIKRKQYDKFTDYRESYRPDISLDELYEATRGIWVVSSRSQEAEYAFTVHKNEIIEVYRIDSWHPGGTNKYNIITSLNCVKTRRKEFLGRLAKQDTWNRYIGENVSQYYKKGEANPIKYINI